MLLSLAALAGAASAAEQSSQVLVLGPHHSATSIVSRALGLMGLFLGEREDLLLQEGNPLKYWERRDVVELNKQRLKQGAPAAAGRDAFPSFVGYGFEPAHEPSLAASVEASKVLAHLNEHRPWATKDPRLSLLASEWLPLLDKSAVCVLTVRHPLDFANSMMGYSDKVGLSEWTGVWRHYMTRALEACAAQPLALVPHAELVSRPYQTLRALHARLAELGVTMPPLEVERLVDNLQLRPPPPEAAYLPAELAAAGPAALELYRMLHGAAVVGKAPALPLVTGGATAPWPAVPARAGRAREAYATLLTGSDASYLAGALALGSSIRALDATRDMVAVVTHAVPRLWHEQLTAVGWSVEVVEKVEEFWWGKHAQCRSFAPDQAVRWGRMATKLRLWQLTRYDKILYLDADALLLDDPAALFAIDSFAAEDGVTHSSFNAGVMVLRPSLDVYAQMLRLTASQPPHLFGSAVDCTEQALLNVYFHGREAGREATLFPAAHPSTGTPPRQATRDAASRLRLAGPPAVAHWITLRCPKPWDVRGEAGAPLVSAGVAPPALPADCNTTLYELWWRVYNRTATTILSEVTVQASRRRLFDEYSGCAPGCPDDWLDDGICDAACNTEACTWDGKDCFHEAGECWTAMDGSDYRGKVARTAAGAECQTWSEQIPWHHTKTTMNYPDSGLGGHNYCRNPDGEAGAWCYTLDYPNMRWDFCDVGQRSESCDANHEGQAMPGGVAAPKANKVGEDEEELSLGKFIDSFVTELEVRFYKLAVPESMTGVKVVLIPINGDADLFLSFSQPKPERRSATWVEESVGVKQFTLPRSNSYFCPEKPCMLHLGVSGFEEGDYKLVVYNFTEAPATSAGGDESGGLYDASFYSCSPGCDELRLGNTVCDLACNTSDCVWDQGDCGYFGEYAMEELCATGCPTSWIDDGYCDEACFNKACSWDMEDCIEGDAGCSDGCLPSFIDDTECDELCHNEGCGWDGSDCDHGADDCYSMPDGQDYRGAISITKSGNVCQMWSRQSPNAHLKTHMNFPAAGLGGHNHCRNPGGEEAGPWCYTLQPGLRFELCDVPPPQANCSAKDTMNTHSPYHYQTLCPVDCATLLGNGLCETRCNISSCAFDRGDCGVGLSLALVAAGYVPGFSRNAVYAMVGSGIAVGVSVGLLVLRCVLQKLKKDEERRRGYTDKEMKGMDMYDAEDA